MDVSYIHKPTSLLPPFPLLTVSTGEGRVIENLILLGVGRRDIGEKKGGERYWVCIHLIARIHLLFDPYFSK